MAYNPNNANGQATAANSAPVVLASDQSAVATKLSDVTATISIAANSTAGGTCTSIGGAATFTVQLTGTFVATVQIQVTRDGTNWVNITGSTSVVNAATGAYMASGNLTAVGIYQCDITGFAGARVITTAYTSGTVTGAAAISQTPGLVSIEGTPNIVVSGTANVTDTKLPTAAAAADSYANPTITHLGADGFMFNGNSWDRVRNNAFVTIADTGAKTASFNSASQINYNARGAIITAIISAVSGTSPTLTAQLQWSPDNGTTWYAYGPATAALSGVGALGILIYPTHFEDASTTTLTALTTGLTVAKLINAPLPRTWRIAYTIAGTSPSFTFTNDYVNYIL